MPVIFAAGRIFTSLVVLPGSEARCRKQSDGKYETTFGYPPKPNYLSMRPVAGIDTNIFYQWAFNFVQESSFFRIDGRKHLLIMDGYACHVLFRTIKLLKNRNTVISDLPTLTSLVLKPLNVGSFGTFKEAFRQQLSLRTIRTKVGTTNDKFTFCEVLVYAFQTLVTGTNAIGGFQKIISWSQSFCSVDAMMIKEKEFISSAVTANYGADLSEVMHTRSVRSLMRTVRSNQSTDHIEAYHQLHSLFLRQSDQLCSDSIVVINCTTQVSRETGATLTSENGINALRSRDERNAVRVGQRL